MKPQNNENHNMDNLELNKIQNNHNNNQINNSSIMFEFIGTKIRKVKNNQTVSEPAIIEQIQRINGNEVTTQNYNVILQLNSFSKQMSLDKNHLNYVIKDEFGSINILTIPSLKKINSPYQSDIINSINKQISNLIRVQQHPNIVKLIENGVAKIKKKNQQYIDCPFYIHQFADQMNLDAYSLKSYNNRQILKQNIFVILKQLVEALKYLHKQKKVLHLDIKPKNILVFGNNIFKLTRFNNSLPIETFNLQKDKKGFSFGTKIFQTPQWISRVDNENLNGQKIDIFNLGVCMLLIHNQFKLDNQGFQWTNFLMLRQINDLNLNQSIECYQKVFQIVALEQYLRKPSNFDNLVEQSPIYKRLSHVFNQQEKQQRLIESHIRQLERQRQQNQRQLQQQNLRARQLQNLIQNQRHLLRYITQTINYQRQHRQQLRHLRNHQNWVRQYIIRQQRDINQLKISQLKQELQKLKDQYKNLSKETEQQKQQNRTSFIEEQCPRQTIIQKLIFGMLHPNPKTRLSIEEIQRLLEVQSNLNDDNGDDGDGDGDDGGDGDGDDDNGNDIKDQLKKKIKLNEEKDQNKRHLGEI